MTTRIETRKADERSRKQEDTDLVHTAVIFRSSRFVNLFFYVLYSFQFYLLLFLNSRGVVFEEEDIQLALQERDTETSSRFALNMVGSQTK